MRNIRGRTSLVIGGSGQDGRYLIEKLLARGDVVFSLSRRYNPPSCNDEQIEVESLTNLRLVHGDIEEAGCLFSNLLEIKPDEIYHLASTHELDLSHESFLKSRKINLDSVAELLDYTARHSPLTKIFYASSANIFANSGMSPQNENTPHNPNSLYGIFKCAAMRLIEQYRAEKGIYCCSGILYSHESPFRNAQFLSKKVITAAVEIKYGSRQKLVLGDLTAMRDWGYAEEFVDAFILMLSQDKPEDFVIGTAKIHSVEYFVDTVFKTLGLDWQEHVDIDSKLVRPKEKTVLCADISKIKKQVGWCPKLNLDQLIQFLVSEEITKFEERFCSQNS